MAEEARGEPHSARDFGPYRDFWWNADCVELLGRRFGLGSILSALDVGAGVGHWGRLLARVLHRKAVVIGIDPEPLWVEEATRRGRQAGLSERYRYRLGRIDALPFNDDSFDLVTCQTVLMHVPKPEAAVAEMARVTRPGGLVLASEPNNRVWFLLINSSNARQPIEERIESIRFYITCEEGRAALGQEHCSIGDLVPGLFDRAGLTDVRAYLNDKVCLMLPPYEAQEQLANRDKTIADARAARWIWTREQSQRYFLAGGGEEDEFEELWNRRLAESRVVADELDAARYCATEAGLQYVIGGRKPSLN